MGGVGQGWIQQCLLTARLLCRMAAAIDSLSASDRFDFSQCVTKIDRSSVGPILFLRWRSKMFLCTMSTHWHCMVHPFHS